MCCHVFCVAGRRIWGSSPFSYFSQLMTCPTCETLEPAESMFFPTYSPVTKHNDQIWGDFGGSMTLSLSALAASLLVGVFKWVIWRFCAVLFAFLPRTNGWVDSNNGYLLLSSPCHSSSPPRRGGGRARVVVGSVLFVKSLGLHG